ncbi:MAG TPA: hypothetical protein VNM92_13825 [Thermoanaerobaculia bacterium]|nr:hypothetical protein [Thermoanaerobaculia bacterium]
MKELKEHFVPLHQGSRDRTKNTGIELGHFEAINRILRDEERATNAANRIGADGRSYATRAMLRHVDLDARLFSEFAGYVALATSVRHEALIDGKLVPYDPREAERWDSTTAPQTFLINGIELDGIRAALHAQGERILEHLDAEEIRQQEALESQAREDKAERQQMTDLLADPMVAGAVAAYIELSDVKDESTLLAARVAARSVGESLSAILRFRGAPIMNRDELASFARAKAMPDRKSA